MSKSRNHRIAVCVLGSRLAAIHLADFEDMDWNTDVVQTGVGRYSAKERELAVEEAQQWAKAEGITYVE